jgi:hypothetical protein
MTWIERTKPLLKWGLLLPMVVVLTTCDGGERARQRQEALDTLTRRQKDSLISTMPIPGAGAVGKAMRAVDSANARTQRTDSIIR